MREDSDRVHEATAKVLTQAPEKLTAKQKEKEYQERQQEILKEEEAKREAEIIALSRDHYLTPGVRGRAHAAYAG